MLRCARNRGLLFYREGRVSAGRAFELLRIRTLRRDLGILASTGRTTLRGGRVAY
jgi:hypothetical protein